jgi:hypothetical protein
MANGEWRVKPWPASFAARYSLLATRNSQLAIRYSLVRKTPTEEFYRIAYVLMFLISVALLWQGPRKLGH